MSRPSPRKTAGAASGTSFKNIAEGLGAAVGALIALLGAPTVYLGIKRSQAEIRKLELETAKLQAEQGVVEGAPLTELSETYNVVIRGNDNRITITADPRLLSPLLLLLDFVTATIILTIAGYLLNFGGLSVLSPILALLGVVLFAPMFREARRLKRALAPGPTGSGDDESTSS